MSLMRSTMVSLVVLAVATLPTVAVAQTVRKFTVWNKNSTHLIQAVWFAQAGTKETWIATSMDGPILPNKNMVFTVTGPYVCFEDVKVKFDDSTEQTFTNVNVCNGDWADAT